MDGGPKSTMQTDFLPGQVIAERYVLQELLGIGGMGEVWAAQHRSLKKDVAIKLIRARWFDDQNIISRFIREARRTRKVEPISNLPAASGVHCRSSQQCEPNANQTSEQERVNE